MRKDLARLLAAGVFLAGVLGHESAAGSSNPYFILTPGLRLTYEGRERVRPVRVVATVLPGSRVVNGTSARVLEERESVRGELTELSLNYFAPDSVSGDVRYLGEDVDEYRRGRVIGHGGSWRAGRRGAKAGMAMPGEPRVGQSFSMEAAAGVAMDRARVLSVTDTVRTPAGSWGSCVKVEETSPLEPGSRSLKYYAPGVGLVRDGKLSLVKLERILP